MKMMAGVLLVLLLALPAAAENGSGTDPVRMLQDENAQLRMQLERKTADQRALEYQVQQAVEELARMQQTIMIMRQELADLTAQLEKTARPAAAVRPAGDAGGSRPRPVIPANARRHTVASGETLGLIAEKYYGSGASWQRIYDANRDKLTSPSMITADMTLIVP